MRTAPTPPGYLAYGPLRMDREHTCAGCHATFSSRTGRGTTHWCPSCQGGEAHRKYLADRNKVYAKRHAMKLKAQKKESNAA